MDPITQGLLGATAAQLVGAKKLPKHAWKLGFLAGMAPDLDIIIRSTQNPLLFFEYHRQFTHSLLFIPIGGIIVGLFCMLLSKPLREFKGLTLLAAILAYGTHGILDATTSYGTVLLWPFNNIRYSWDIMSIVDPIVTLILLVFLIFSVKRRSGLIAALGLFTTVSYFGFGAWQHHRAIQAQDQFAIQQEQTITRARAMPGLGHLISWRGVYLSKDKLYFTKISTPLFSEAKVTFIMKKPLYTEQDLPNKFQINSILLQDYEIFSWFTDDYVFKVSSEPLVLCDARYAFSTQPKVCMWGIKFPSDMTRRKHVYFIRNIQY